jgi:hypothetical protein
MRLMHFKAPAQLTKQPRGLFQSKPGGEMHPQKKQTIHLLNIPARLCMVFMLLLTAFAPSGAARASERTAGIENTTPQTLPFSQDWANTDLITVNDDWSAVHGIVGHLGDYTASSPTAIDPQTLLSDYSLTAIDVIANQTNPNTLTAGGVAEFHITSRVALQGSGRRMPFVIIHLEPQVSNIAVATCVISMVR